MKTRLLFTLVFCAQVCSAGIASRLELCRPLIDPPAKGMAARLRVPGDVFGQSRSFPDDLRILDSAGTQWPFFIITPADRLLSEKRVPQVLNKAFVGGAEPHWKMDLLMPEGEARAIHNQLEITTTGTDFVRRVEISYRDEAGTSARLGSGYLVRFPGARSARNDRVSYPDSDAGRLRVKVYTSAKNAGETFEIQRVALYCKSTISAEREPVPFDDCPVPAKEQEEKAQVFILDSGFESRPVEFITFGVADASFVRRVSVFGRHAENEPWQSVGGGGIHRFEKGEETTVHIRASHRWLKVIVRQDDNLPLDIQSIRLEAVPRYLVFEAAGDLSARLCFRGWDIPSPRYDLRRRLSDTAALALPVVELGEVQPNASPGALSTLRKYSGVLGGVVIGAVSLLVVWVIIRMMRQNPAA